MLERAFKKRIPSWGPRDLGPVRWQMARGQATREVVKEVVRTRSHDAVHLTSHAAGLTLGTLHRQMPIVLSVDVPVLEWQQILRGISEGSPPSWDMKLALQLERRALEAAALVIAWTETVGSQLRRAAPTAEVITLHPGLDVDAFAPGAARDPRDPVKVLFVGARFAAKGGHDLLSALEADLGRGVELDVVTTSDVPAREGLRLHRLGPGDPELLWLFREADIFCMPSHSDAVPWVVLEAMAAGCAVVSSHVGSIPEMLGLGTAGVTVRAGDVRGLRAALRSLVADVSARANFGHTARARVAARYNSRYQSPQLASIMRDVVARRGKAVPTRP